MISFDLMNACSARSCREMTYGNQMGSLPAQPLRIRKDRGYLLNVTKEDLLRKPLTFCYLIYAERQSM